MTTTTTEKLYEVIEDFAEEVHVSSEWLGVSPLMMWLALKTRAEHEIQLLKKLTDE